MFVAVAVGVPKGGAGGFGAIGLDRSPGIEVAVSAGVGVRVDTSRGVVDEEGVGASSVVDVSVGVSEGVSVGRILSSVDSRIPSSVDSWIEATRVLASIADPNLVINSAGKSTPGILGRIITARMPPAPSNTARIFRFSRL